MERPRLEEVRVLQNYRLWLRYSDGAAGEVDLASLAGRGVFKAWKERKFFEAVKIDNAGALTWGEEIELCSDALYLKLTGKSPEDIFPRLKPVEADA